MKTLLKSITVLALIVSVWGFVLPALSRTATIRQRQEWLDANGIDPAAMFYTELPRLMLPSQTSTRETADDQALHRGAALHRIDALPCDGRRIDESL